MSLGEIKASRMMPGFWLGWLGKQQCHSHIFLPSEKSAEQIYGAWDYQVIGMEAPRFLWGCHYSPPNLGLWAYDETTENWYHVGDRMKELETMANKCMDAINGGI